MLWSVPDYVTNTKDQLQWIKEWMENNSPYVSMLTPYHWSSHTSFSTVKNSFRTRQHIHIHLQAHDQSPKFKAKSKTPHPFTKENTTSASPDSLSSTSKLSYNPTTGRTPNPLSFSPFSSIWEKVEILKEPEVKEGWMRSWERTEY